MKASIERPAGARLPMLRRAANRLAFVVVALVVVAIFTAICMGAALAAALLSIE